MAEEEQEKKQPNKEVKKEEQTTPDYDVWSPNYMLNHVYTLADGQKIVWTIKSGAEKPSLKVVTD